MDRPDLPLPAEFLDAGVDAPGLVSK